MKVKFSSIAKVALGAALVAGGVETGVAADAAATKVPHVLIIGDSISNGYTPIVQELLKGKAEVVHAPGNNESTVRGLEKLDAWLGSNTWDVIHFNWGLHDMKYIDAKTKLTEISKGTQWVPVEQYEPNLKTLVQRLKKTGAKLIWCSTTPVPEGVTGRVPGDEVKYNAAACRVMLAEGIPIDDLHAVVGTPQNRTAMGGRPKDVHYTAAGYNVLASEVVKAIDKALVR